MNSKEREFLIKVTQNLLNKPIYQFLEKTGQNLLIGKGKSTINIKPRNVTLQKILSNLKSGEYKKKSEWDNDIEKIYSPKLIMDEVSQKDQQYISCILIEAKKNLDKELESYPKLSPTNWLKTLIKEKDKINFVVSKTRVVEKENVKFISCSEIQNIIDMVQKVPQPVQHKIYKAISENETDKVFDESKDNVIDLATLKTETLINIRSIIKKWCKHNNVPYPQK